MASSSSSSVVVLLVVVQVELEGLGRLSLVASTVLFQLIRAQFF